MDSWFSLRFITHGVYEVHAMKKFYLNLGASCGWRCQWIWCLEAGDNQCGWGKWNETDDIYIYTYEYPTKVPNTQIRFRWTSCRGTMHQTLITDRGRPKNRYPYNLSVRVSCAKPVGLSIEFAILQPFGVSSVDRDIPIFDIFAVSPTDTQTDTNRYPKAMANLSGKPSGQNSFGLHHENPYLQPFFRQHQMDQVYVCLVSFSMHFIHVVCLAVSLFLFAG